MVKQLVYIFVFFCQSRFIKLVLGCHFSMTANVTACCRPSNLKTFPAEPHYKFIFIYGRGQHAPGWQQTDVTCSNRSKVFSNPNKLSDSSNPVAHLCSCRSAVAVHALEMISDIGLIVGSKPSAKI